MPDWLDQLEIHHELAMGGVGYDQAAPDQLVAMRTATINQHLEAETDRFRLRHLHYQTRHPIAQLEHGG